MRKIDIYEDFYFNKKRLSDFGGVIISDDEATITPVLPQKDILSERIIGTDIEVVYGSRLNPRTFDITVFFNDFINIREFAAWLHTTGPEDFYYIGDSVKLHAMINDSLDMELYYGGYNEDRDLFKGIAVLKFIAHDPYYYYIEDKTFTYNTFAAQHIFDCGATIKSFPRIKFEVTGTQNVVYKLNGIQTELNGVNQYCYIDGLYRTVEDFVGNKRHILKGAYPVLKPRENIFELINGSVNSVTIECRSRLI